MYLWNLILSLDASFSNLNVGRDRGSRRKSSGGKVYSKYHLEVEKLPKLCVCVCVCVCFGCALWLAGSFFPNQRLNTGHGSESAKF